MKEYLEIKMIEWANFKLWRYSQILKTKFILLTFSQSLYMIFNDVYLNY
jgi:hypothetical protein